MTENAGSDSGKRIDLKKISFVAALIAIIGLGLGFRALNFVDNTSLFGDLNLFSMSAENITETGELRYPVKYVYNSKEDYTSFTNLASQHPPLWPYSASFIVRFSPLSDHYLAMKIMSLVSYLLLIVLVCWYFRNKPVMLLVSQLFLCTSPLLIDYSANGSMYILMAALLVAYVMIIARFDDNKWCWFILAGIVCGLGYITHGAMMVLIPSTAVVWFLKRKKIKPQKILVFVIVFIMVISPYLIWNLQNFGTLFYSTTLLHFAGQVNALSYEIENDAVVAKVESFNPGMLWVYGRQALAAGFSMLKIVFLELGPFVILLSCLGLVILFNKKREVWLWLLLTGGFYLLIIFAWITTRQRFLVPAMPIIIIFASYGFNWLMEHRNKVFKMVGIGLVAVAVCWNMFLWLEPPLNRYYPNQKTFNTLSDLMKPVAEELGKLEDGRVLCISTLLDGGRESYHHSRKPVIVARKFLNNGEIIRKLKKDFEPKYVWFDRYTARSVKQIFPKTRILFGNKYFFVGEFSE